MTDNHERPTSVFILVDPPQDYEESLRILGVYTTRVAAEMAAPFLAESKGRNRNGYESSWYFEVQEWCGIELVETTQVPEGSR